MHAIFSNNLEYRFIATIAQSINTLEMDEFQEKMSKMLHSRLYTYGVKVLCLPTDLTHCIARENCIEQQTTKQAPKFHHPFFINNDEKIKSPLN